MSEFKMIFLLIRCNDKPCFVVGSYLSRCIVANTFKRSSFANPM